MYATVETDQSLTMRLRQGQPVVFKSDLSKEEFHRYLLRNPELRIERDKHGIVTIHPFMSYDSGISEGDAFFFLKLWAKQHPRLGKVFSPSTSFNMPDGSDYKADGAFISMQKHNSLTEDERKHIASIVPDFVMEVRSNTDSINKLKKKMEEAWIANGVRLAWLIDPIKQKAWVYRLDGSSEDVPDFSYTLNGEDVLPGFELKLSELIEE
ncbi:MAG: Uma2 family endonuclease [Bacteroidota bacterium]